MINLYGLSLEKLEELMLTMGQTKYRAKQLFTWIYEKEEIPKNCRGCFMFCDGHDPHDGNHGSSK